MGEKDVEDPASEKTELVDKKVAETLEKAESNPADWRVVGVKTRVDSFTQEALMEDIRLLTQEGHKRIALDLKANRFLSFPVIKYCVEVAAEVASEGGRFALIACPEKTKRHFEIYGSLDHIEMVRTPVDLVQQKKTRKKI